MPIAALDAVTALVVGDLQKGVVGLRVTPPIDQVIGNTVQLLRAFRRRRLPVVLDAWNPRPAWWVIPSLPWLS